MKKLFILILVSFYTYFIIHIQPKTELEIYTNDNIYYIEGLTVTCETSNEIVILNSRKELKYYISELTAEAVK